MREEMEGEGEGEIVDGGFGSEMEGSARAFDRRWRATVTWSDQRYGE